MIYINLFLFGLHFCIINKLNRKCVIDQPSISVYFIFKSCKGSVSNIELFTIWYKKIPNIVILGKEEAKSKTVTIRKLGSQEKFSYSLKDFLGEIVKEAQK